MSFKSLDPQDFLVSADSLTAPCWSNYAPELSTMFTSSTQVNGSSGTYFLNIYNANPDVSASAEVQFNIAYGNKLGSGSVPYNASYENLTPTRTVYGQWRNLIYGDEFSNFSFGTGVSAVTPEMQHFYVITLDRARYRQSLLPGSLNLTLYSGSFELNLTDNSGVVTTIEYCDAGRVYQVVSGSSGSPVSNAYNGYTANSGSYGLFLPDIGAIVLNASALDLPFTDGGIRLGTDLTSTAYNPGKLYTTNGTIGLLTGSAGFKSSFFLNSQETVTSDFVFCRARNGEFNYTENPSFISGSTGAILYDLFINNPQTYITTVGLYNDQNELLAVAKLSKPLKKDFTKEALIRVKLDF
jgi:hypothetical protein